MLEMALRLSLCEWSRYRSKLSSVNRSSISMSEGDDGRSGVWSAWSGVCVSWLVYLAYDLSMYLDESSWNLRDITPSCIRKTRS